MFLANMIVIVKMVYIINFNKILTFVVCFLIQISRPEDNNQVILMGKAVCGLLQ